MSFVKNSGDIIADKQMKNANVRFTDTQIERDSIKKLLGTSVKKIFNPIRTNFISNDSKENSNKEVYIYQNDGKKHFDTFLPKEKEKYEVRSLPHVNLSDGISDVTEDETKDGIYKGTVTGHRCSNHPETSGRSRISFSPNAKENQKRSQKMSKFDIEKENRYKKEYIGHKEDAMEDKYDYFDTTQEMKAHQENPQNIQNHMRTIGCQIEFSYIVPKFTKNLKFLQNEKSDSYRICKLCFRRKKTKNDKSKRSSINTKNKNGSKSNDENKTEKTSKNVSKNTQNENKKENIINGNKTDKEINNVSVHTHNEIYTVNSASTISNYDKFNKRNVNNSSREFEKKINDIETYKRQNKKISIKERSCSR